MLPTLTWLDLTSRDRDKMRRVLDLFSEQGTVDEMGLGSLRDALSDALFPGTSAIQTRLRYVLFIPWIYERLENKRIPSDRVAQEARSAELALIAPLIEADDREGVIGARARGNLRRLPSHVYWAALVRWNIFQFPQSQSWYHTHFRGLSRGVPDTYRADDPGVIWAHQRTWHPRLPPPPETFPDTIDFNLTHQEADFIQGRLLECCSGSLLAWLAREGSTSPADSFWSDPDALRASEPITDTIELARRFSLHVEGAPILYNLLLAERRHERHGGDAERIEQYRDTLTQWALAEQNDVPFDPGALWAFLARRGARLAEPQCRFVEAWTRRLIEIGPQGLLDDALARRLIEHRELQLKGGRARLGNDGRLLEWSGGVGLGRMDFRWFRVRQLVSDLHRGLQS